LGAMLGERLLRSECVPFSTVRLAGRLYLAGAAGVCGVCDP